MSYFYIITDKLKLLSKIFRVEIMDQENRLNLIFGIIFIKYLKYLKTFFSVQFLTVFGRNTEMYR